jgi:mycoredoxin
MLDPWLEGYPTVSRPLSPAAAPVVVYGTSWCAGTQLIRRHLERLGIPYRYVDLERDPVGAAQVRWWNGGRMTHPTVSVGGSVLVEPSLDELEWTLAEAGLV